MKTIALWFAALALVASIAACGGGGSDNKDDSTGEPSATDVTSGDLTDLNADLGFRPATDGYSFENFGNDYPNTPGTLDFYDMIAMFGAEAVCEDPSTGECVLVPGAEVWLDAANRSSNGGHCEGFSVTSLRFFLGLDNPADYGADTTHDLTIDGNDALRHFIAYYMASQSVEPVASTTAETRNGTPTHILQEISAALNAGEDPLTMGIYKQGGGGHAIVPYAVQDQGDGIYWVMVYDNNWPDQERHVEIDTNADTWVYDLASTNPGEPAEPWGGDAETFSMDLTPMSTRQATYVCPWCGGDAGGGSGDRTQRKSVILFGDSNVTVTDTAGNTLTAGDTIDNNIPGASASQGKLTKNLTQDNPPVYIYLPADADVTIEMTSEGIDAGEAARSGESIFVMGQGNAVAIDNFDLTDGESSTLTISGDSDDISFQTSDAEQPSMRMAVDSEDGADYLFEVSGLDFNPGEQVDLAADEDTGKFDIQSSDPEADDYDIRIVRSDADGQDEYTNDDVGLDSGETDGFDYSAWEGEGDDSITIEEDTNSDGSVDETTEETDEDINEAPDDGSVEVPTEDAGDGSGDDTGDDTEEETEEATP